MGLAYVLTIFVLGGLESKHVIIASLVLLDSYNSRTRTFLKYFTPFILTGMAYDSMRYYYWQGIEGNVHVSEPYFLEKKLFGIESNGTVLTPNEYFERNNWKILDFFAGFAYITFVFEYLGTGFLLLFARQLAVLRTFGWCFFTVNIMGFATYFIYPAAPPWYVAAYGLGPARTDVVASPAGAARFDQLMGTHFFDAMYGMSVDVYGAIPSLHVSYPLLVAWAALSVKRFRTPAIVFFLLMCFSAVYLNHHYIIDVILGILYSLTAFVIVRGIESWLQKRYARSESESDRQINSLKSDSTNRRYNAETASPS